ncbi:MAG: CRISPR-associated endonuclease Cas2 [Thermoanaerobaculia bacterium]
MLIVVAYDIPDDRRRTCLAKALEDFGERVQYSVFECRLEPAQIERLSARVVKLIDGEKDSVRIYRVCGECAGKIVIHGWGKVTQDPAVYVL